MEYQPDYEHPGYNQVQVTNSEKLTEAPLRGTKKAKVGSLGLSGGVFGGFSRSVVYTSKHWGIWTVLGLAWLPDEPRQVDEHQDQKGSCKEREDSVHGLLSGIKKGASADCIGLFQANLSLGIDGWAARGQALQKHSRECPCGFRRARNFGYGVIRGVAKGIKLNFNSWYLLGKASKLLK
jgi:hypothetical protein